MESKSNYHIITPFYRYENEEFLKENTKGFIWHKIEGTIPDVKDQSYGKLNYFIQNNEIIDEDYYQVLNDDDALPQSFLSVTESITGDLVMFSMLRGDHVPKGRPEVQSHPTDPLIAKKENMCVGDGGIQQIRMKGKILKTLVFEDQPYADGVMLEHLKKNYPIVFKPDIYILFNYLEPGRYEQRM